MAVKLDRTIVTSEFEALKNYLRATTSITVTGTIATGTNLFQSTVTLPLSGTIVEVYYQAPSVTYKKRADNLLRLTEYVGADYANLTVGYTSTSLTITVGVQNGGAPYTATDQTFNFTIILYNAPVT